MKEPWHAGSDRGNKVPDEDRGAPEPPDRREDDTRDFDRGGYGDDGAPIGGPLSDRGGGELYGDERGGQRPGKSRD